MSSYDLIKQFDNHIILENNQIDYQLIKSRKRMFNVQKCNMYKNCNSKKNDYLILPKNNYPNLLFNGQAQQWVDFELPKLERDVFDKFVLSFYIGNTSTTYDGWINAYIIDHVQVIVNNNVVGQDIDQYQILFQNLNRCNNIDSQNCSAGMNLQLNHCLGMSIFNGSGWGGISDWGTAYKTNTLLANNGQNFKFELPISLQNSGILGSSLNDTILIRVYFKASINIVPTNGTGVPGGADCNYSVSSMKLYLKTIELTNCELNSYIKQPKINFPFTKWVNKKYTLNNIGANAQNYSVPLLGFNSITSGMFIYLTMNSDNNVNNPNAFPNTFSPPYLFVIPIDDVYITNNLGQNIHNGIKYDIYYTNYKLGEHFPSFNNSIQNLCHAGHNDGEFHYINFCNQGDENIFNNVYNGGHKFHENTLNFTYIGNNAISSLIVNVVFFQPAHLEVNNGILTENYC